MQALLENHAAIEQAFASQLQTYVGPSYRHVSDLIEHPDPIEAVSFIDAELSRPGRFRVVPLLLEDAVRTVEAIAEGVEADPLQEFENLRRRTLLRLRHTQPRHRGHLSDALEHLGGLPGTQSLLEKLFDLGCDHRAEPALGVLVSFLRLHGLRHHAKGLSEIDDEGRGRIALLLQAPSLSCRALGENWLLSTDHVPPSAEDIDLVEMTRLSGARHARHIGPPPGEPPSCATSREWKTQIVADARSLRPADTPRRITRLVSAECFKRIRAEARCENATTAWVKEKEQVFLSYQAPMHSDVGPLIAEALLPMHKNGWLRGPEAEAAGVIGKEWDTLVARGRIDTREVLLRVDPSPSIPLMPPAEKPLWLRDNCLHPSPTFRHLMDGSVAVICETCRNQRIALIPRHRLDEKALRESPAPALEDQTPAELASYLREEREYSALAGLPAAPEDLDGHTALSFYRVRDGVAELSPDDFRRNVHPVIQNTSVRGMIRSRAR